MREKNSSILLGFALLIFGGTGLVCYGGTAPLSTPTPPPSAGAGKPKPDPVPTNSRQRGSSADVTDAKPNPNSTSQVDPGGLATGAPSITKEMAKSRIAELEFKLKGAKAPVDVQGIQQGLNDLKKTLTTAAISGAKLQSFNETLQRLNDDFLNPNAQDSNIPPPKSNGRDRALTEIEGLEAKVDNLKENKAVIALKDKISTLKGSIPESAQTSFDYNAFESKFQVLDAEYNRLKKETGDDEWSWLFILKWAGILVLALGAIGGLIWALIAFKKKLDHDLGMLRASVSDLKSRLGSHTEKLETLTKITTDLTQQIAAQKSELNRIKQNASGREDTGPPVPTYSAPREQPRFPVSVDDYIARIGGVGIPVTYDYKEGMLVSDTTKEGGLLIVQDQGRHYLVPSFGFFQTKSDYTNYFERFYGCARPMGGNVWIVQPAEARQVPGGWKVDNMGELDVR